MSTDLARRPLIQSGAALAAASLVSAPALAQIPPATGPKPMSYAIKPLPLDPKSIKGLSEKILTSHYENNYFGAVKQLNAITEQLAQLDYSKAAGFHCQRPEARRADRGQLNDPARNLFCRPWGAARTGRRACRCAGARFRQCRSLARRVRRDGQGRGRRLGLGHLGMERLINCWAADHTTNLAGGQPVLVLDMYEHAYHMDYGAKAGDYVEASMKAIRWANADELYARSSRAA
jgi:Fe-Mn family superoxide dismutase